MPDVPEIEFLSRFLMNWPICLLNWEGGVMASIATPKHRWPDEYTHSRAGQSDHSETTQELSPEQINMIRELWDEKPILEIAKTIGAKFEVVQSFTRSHYLYFKYLRQPTIKKK